MSSMESNSVPDFDVSKRKYFSQLAVKLKGALELHRSFNLLKRNDDNKREWGNVSEHCLVVAARAKALSALIGLKEKTKDDIVFAAGVHDFYKRNQIQKTPNGVSLSMNDYIESEKEAAEELTKAGIPQNIIDYVGSTGALPEAVYKINTILEKQQTASEEEIATLVLHYVDDYSRGSNWAKLAEVGSQGRKTNDLNRRIEEARNNPKYKSINEEGRKYFDGKSALEVQEEVGELVEQFLARKISETTGKVVDPKQLPTFIDEEIRKEIRKMNANMHDEIAENVEGWEGRFEQITLDALHAASLVHNNLGVDGEASVQKNQFGETALRVDIECEKAILNFLRTAKMPIRVISEEHGQVDITQNPRYLGILDGLDGSAVYKEERGTGRYGTMFAIFDTTNPTYKDYLVSGIMEHATGRLFFAEKNKGAFTLERGRKIPARTSGKTSLDEGAKIYEDNHFEINRTTFSDKTRGFNVQYIRSSAVCYADVMTGAADLGLECTRKSNLEIAVAYGLVAEAGGIMIDLNGVPLADRKYLDFGQEEQIPIITAATPELAKEFLAHLKK